MPRLAFLAFLALLAATGLSFGNLTISAAHAQPTAKSFAQPRFFGLTADQILERKPESPNPYVALLPEGVEPDYDYWNARLALESYRRALRRDLLGTRGGTRGGLPRSYTEREADARGANDAVDTAEPLPAFPTGRGGTLEVTGNFGPALAPAPTDVAATAEGPAGKLDPQPLTVGGTGAPRLRVNGARVGDGAYGTSTGDVDLYILDVRTPSAHLKVRVDTPESDLDPVLALYTENGTLVDYNDDSPPGTDAGSIVLLDAPDRYYLFVYGYTPSVQTAFGLQNPNNPASGFGVGSTGPYTLDVALVTPDPDSYSIPLQAGDVLALTTPSNAMYDLAVFGPDGTLRMRSRQDISPIYPEAAPFVTPSELDPSNNTIVGKTVVVVAPATGTYTVVAHGEGAYRIHVLSTRPRVDAFEGGRQTIFVDFDGATMDAAAIFGQGNAVAVLSPLRAFLPRWGLAPTQESAVIDAVLANLRENLLDDLRRSSNNPDADLVLLNSRDDPDPFGTPGVSRLIIGGTIAESGLETIGLASSIDPGNFNLEDTAVILLDLLSEPAGDPNSLNQYALGPGRAMVQLVGEAVGNITAHEAGHFLGLFHTDQFNSRPALQDAGGNLDNTVGIGRDRAFGTADDVDVDFAPDLFVPEELFIGTEDQANTVAFGISRAGGASGGRAPGGLFTASDTTGGIRVAAVRGGAPASEGYTYDFGDFRVRVTGPSGQETLWVLQPGSEVWREAEPCAVALLLLEAGTAATPTVEGTDGTDSAEAQAAYARLLRLLGAAR